MAAVHVVSRGDGLWDLRGQVLATLDGALAG